MGPPIDSSGKGDMTLPIKNPSEPHTQEINGEQSIRIKEEFNEMYINLLLLFILLIYLFIYAITYF
jgi:hypothetical protein